MKEQKPLMKKESNKKYLIIGILIVLGIAVYFISQINFTEIDLFKGDTNIATNAIQSNITSASDFLEGMGDSSGGLLLLVASIFAFFLAIVLFILPLFRSVGEL